MDGETCEDGRFFDAFLVVIVISLISCSYDHLLFGVGRDF